jgi:hypothetical protein
MRENFLFGLNFLSRELIPYRIGESLFFHILFRNTNIPVAGLTWQNFYLPKIFTYTV